MASLARAKSHAVTIFGTSTTGLDVGDTAAAFFAAHLSFPSVRLFFIGQPRDPHPMLTPTVSGDDGQVSHPQKIRFMDVGPMLLTTSASANDAASRLPDDAAPFDVSKFRPNIHISTPPDVAAYDEEFWREIVIGEGLRLACTFNAARCLSINVDYGSGTQARKEEQLYRLMTKDRRINPIYQYKPCFGRYCFCTEDDAVVRVGDRVKVVERNEKRHVEGRELRSSMRECMGADRKKFRRYGNLSTYAHRHHCHPIKRVHTRGVTTYCIIHRATPCTRE